MSTALAARPAGSQTSFPVCLVLGSEREGVSQPVIDMADAVVTIPMLGMANSLNVVSAAAIILYRLVRLAQKQ